MDIVVLEYRFYRLNAEGKIESASDHIFEDDLAALEKATAMLADQPIEAWQAQRLVFRLNPDGTSAI